jgi:hypothetical protein
VRVAAELLGALLNRTPRTDGLLSLILVNARSRPVARSIVLCIPPGHPGGQARVGVRPPTSADPGLALSDTRAYGGGAILRRVDRPEDARVTHQRRSYCALPSVQAVNSSSTGGFGVRRWP